MKKNTAAILAIVTMLPLAASLGGCLEAAVVAGGAAVVASHDRRTAGTLVEDEGIELRVSNRISERFGDKVHVNNTSFMRTVLLTGEVPNSPTRAEIEKIAQGVPSVRGVINELQVVDATSLTSRATDATITGKVKGRFLDSGKFNPVHVKVVTEAAVVYLMGLVTEAEAHESVELARTTGGVKKVVKAFEYCKPTDAACSRGADPAAGQAKK